MPVRKEKTQHLKLPHKLTRVQGNKKVNNEMLLESLGKVFKAIDTLRFVDNSQGTITIASDGALEFNINLPKTQFQGEYRNDGLVIIGADREEVNYQFTDVINYRYTKDGKTIQEYDHWLEADSLSDVEEMQYVFYEFRLLDTPDDEGNNVEAKLMADDDYPIKTEEDNLRYVVIGRTGEAGTWYQFHRGDIELDFAAGGGSATTLVPWRASFGSAGGGIFETWSVDADQTRAAVIPEILYAVDGIAKNTFVQVPVELPLSNYGPDEATEPVPETFERTLAIGQTHYYWVKFTDAYESGLAADIQPVTTTEPDVTLAPSDEVWKILWEVTATSEPYTPDGASPRTGTKYTIVQKNEDIFEFAESIVSTQIFVKITSGQVGSLIGDVYDNRAGQGTAIATGVVITAPELTRGTLPTNKIFPGEIVGASNYYIYPSSVY